MSSEREPLHRTTPWKFYELLVLPNYEDYCEAEDDVRRGFNASVAAFQLADIFLKYYERVDPSKIARWPRAKALHRHLSNLEPGFRTVQSVAFVYKHLYASKGHYEVGSPLALGGVVYRGTEIVSDWGRPSGGSVVVHRRDGSMVCLKEALEAVVLQMWPGFLPDETET
jgi:hypothetical protein